MARKVIIDTDPGCDDILALLFALASSPDEIEVLLISVTYGNVEVQGCLRNVMSMFSVIDKEIAWRNAKGLPAGFSSLLKNKPIVAVGAKAPLAKQSIMADYYHGIDGLGNVHETHPHHSTPQAAYGHLFSPSKPFKSLTPETVETDPLPLYASALFKTTPASSPDSILHLLSIHPEDAITLIAIGPLTTFALAASQDTTAFLRAKEVLVMGGALSVPGNITPVAEFNCIADPVAAAQIYALTSPKPASTMPLGASSSSFSITTDKHGNSKKPFSYPRNLPKQLPLTIFPLDITSLHTLSRHDTEKSLSPLIRQGSPLAEWVSVFLEATFQKTESLYNTMIRDPRTSMELHDIVTIWYALSTTSTAPPPDDTTGLHTTSSATTTTSASASSSAAAVESSWTISPPQDIRIETTGQWTRGMHVLDRRGYLPKDVSPPPPPQPPSMSFPLVPSSSPLQGSPNEEQARKNNQATLRDETTNDLLHTASQAQAQTQTQSPAPIETQTQENRAIPASSSTQNPTIIEEETDDIPTIIPELKGDSGNWLQWCRGLGNRVRVCVGTPDFPVRGGKSTNGSGADGVRGEGGGRGGGGGGSSGGAEEGGKGGELGPEILRRVFLL